jgi:hypothetical protein
MQTLVLEIRDLETVQAIEETAKRQGKSPVEYALDLLKTALLAQKPFEEIVEPLAQNFDESGMTEEEFDELIERERQALWEEKRGRK